MYYLEYNNMVHSINIYSTFSSHKLGKFINISIGFVSAAIITNSTYARFNAFITYINFYHYITSFAPFFNCL